MKTSSVSYESVRDACNALFAQGKNASFDLVYDLIGRIGSKEVVTQMIVKWRREIAEAQEGREHPTLPSEIVSAIDALAEKLLQQAIQISRKDLDEHYIESLSIRDAAEERAKSAEKALAVEQDLRRVDVAAIADLKLRVKDLEAQQRESEIAKSARDAMCAAIEERCSEMSARIRQQESDLASERKRHEARIEDLSGKHNAAIAALHDTYAAQIRADREAMDGERRHLMAQTDEIRREAGAKEKILQAQLAQTNGDVESLRARLDESAKLLATAKETAAGLKGQLDAMRSATPRISLSYKKPPAQDAK